MEGYVQTYLAYRALCGLHSSVLCVCVRVCLKGVASILFTVSTPTLPAPPPPPPRPFNQDEEADDAGDTDAYYVDKEIIEQQLQTKTYQMSREEAKL